jgi:hypothetical protein
VEENACQAISLTGGCGVNGEMATVYVLGLKSSKTEF